MTLSARRRIAHPGFRDNKTEPIGRCVFCGNDRAPDELTDEHVIPRAIGGRLILTEASCTTCCRITSGIESKVLNLMFSTIRPFFGYRISSSKKLKTRFPVHIERNGRSELRQVPIHEYPVQLALPVFLPPALLSAHPATIPPIIIKRWGFGDDYHERVSSIVTATGATHVKSLPHTYPLDSFGRMLAKIGHCLAVGHLGVDGFTPMLRDVILKPNEPLERFVGTANNFLGMPENKPKPHHQYCMEIIRRDGFENELVVCYFRLFSVSNDVPVYAIVVGEGTPTTGHLLAHPDWPKGDA